MRILGTNGDEVGRELHFSVAEVDCVLQIHNGGVVGIVYGEREVDGAENAFVWTDLAEGFGTEHGLSGLDFDSRDVGGGDCRRDDEQQRNDQAGEFREHGPEHITGVGGTGVAGVF